MITNKNSGLSGRTGNTMFIYAAGFGLAKKLGVEYGLPYVNALKNTKYGYYDFISRKWIPYRFMLSDVFKITAVDIPRTYQPKYLYYEKFFQFDDNFFQLKDGTDIDGWFQSYKYFEHCKDDLRKEFTFKDFYIESALNHWKKFGFDNSDKEKLMISMRIGDGYDFDKNFNVTELEYYQKALQKFNANDFDIVITADKPNKAKDLLKPIIGEQNVFVLDEPDAHITLAFYSLCDHFIISNSTFGWWGSWLGNNTNKKVVLPKKWFNADVNTDDLYLKEWIKV